MLRSYKYRLYPTKAQVETFERTLRLCCELYNAALQERRDAWDKQRVRVTRFAQSYEIKDVRREREDVRDLYVQVVHDVIDRVDRAFKGFFGRCKSGKAGRKGYPRFRSWRRYDSFTYKCGSGFRLDGKRLFLSKIGYVPLEPWPSDPVCGEGVEIKTVTVKREPDGWYAVFACEAPQPEPLPLTQHVVGIDVGLLQLVTTSDGEVLGDLAPLKRAEHKLRHWQRVVSRRRKGSNRRRKAVLLLHKAHQRLARTRKAQLDRISRYLVTENDVIGIEDPETLSRLTRAGSHDAQGRGLRRNIHHAAWATLARQLAYKAEAAGRVLVKVPPAGTSQTCSSCGVAHRLTLAARTLACTCGLTINRDVNAARNIRERALRVLRRGVLEVESPTTRETLSTPLVVEPNEACCGYG